MRVLIACEFSGTVREAFRARGWDAWSCDLLPSRKPGPHYVGDVRNMLDGWQPVAFAAECDPNGDGWCMVRDCDPSECPCLGPTQDGVEYREVDGILFGRHEDSPRWDLIIAHPPCTYLTNSAEWAYADPDFVRYPGVGYHQKVKPGTLVGAERRKARVDALDFVKLVFDAPCEHVAVENPAGVIGTALRVASQFIHPHQFGDSASKKTGLWLNNLPLLMPTEHIAGRMVYDKNLKRMVERWDNQTDSGQNKLSPSEDRWAERSVTYRGISEAFADQWGRYVEDKIKAGA